MLIVAPVREELRIALTAEQQKLVRHRQAESEALGAAGDHARRLFGARANRPRRHQSALPRAVEGVRAAEPAAACW